MAEEYRSCFGVKLIAGKKYAQVIVLVLIVTSDTDAAFTGSFGFREGDCEWIEQLLVYEEPDLSRYVEKAGCRHLHRKSTIPVLSSAADVGGEGRQSRSLLVKRVEGT